HYHPQIRLSSGDLAGVEALVRWQHPELGLLPPGSFIPIAEESGLIRPLGKWVLMEACRQSKAWAARYGRHVPVAVNLSVGQLNAELIGIVHHALTISDLPAHCLELEITESQLMQDVDESVRVLRTLSESGVSIAIDDFGTGYS